MNKCGKCGNYIPEDVTHCPHCGSKPPFFLPLVLGVSLAAAGGASVYMTVNSPALGTGAKVFLALFAITLLWVGLWLIKGAFDNLFEAQLRKKYRACAEHRYVRPCHCEICGKARDHAWDGCKCTACGETRDAEHHWDGCKCTVCGKKRDEEHRWDGCKCTVCGKVRDAEHHWDGCKCTVCGKVRDAEHQWDGCMCTVCGKVRDERHDWQAGKACKCVRCGAYGEAATEFLSYVKGFSYLNKSDASDLEIVEKACSLWPWEHFPILSMDSEATTEQACSGEPIYAMWEKAVSRDYVVVDCGKDKQGRVMTAYAERDL